MKPCWTRASMGAERRRQRRRRWLVTGSSLWLAFGCLRPQPTPDGAAPSSAPAAETPVAPEPLAPQETLAPAPAPPTAPRHDAAAGVPGTTTGGVGWVPPKAEARPHESKPQKRAAPRGSAVDLAPRETERPATETCASASTVPTAPP